MSKRDVRRRATPPGRVRKPRDPLLAYTRPELVTKVRAAWAERDVARAERDRAEQQYRRVLGEHVRCAERIFELEARLAGYEEWRDSVYRTMLEHEQRS